MLQIKRILVPTDFSDSARHAMRLACELAETFGAEIRLLHVQKDSAPYHGYDFDCPDELRCDLDSLPGLPWSETLCVTRAIRVGPPPLEIVTEAVESDSDMIVIGTQGHGAIKHLLLGSVAEKVVRTASCPVVTVRQPAEIPAEETA